MRKDVNEVTDKNTEELLSDLLKDNFLVKTPQEIINSKDKPNVSTKSLKNHVFIKQIYFPFYKNFEPFSKIDFNFPLTVLVGKNGSGKSSILHALYGCPNQLSPSDYWFSTKVDPIEDGDGKNRHCFVYTYLKNGKQYQVCYHRSSRPGTKTKDQDFDSWETAGYVAKYHMERELAEHLDPQTGKISRTPPMDCNLIYIDFREELSAYDKYFYFGDPSKTKQKKKQDFLRLKSAELNNVLNGNKKVIFSKDVAQNEEVVDLTPKELHYISNILGVTYSAGKLIKHHFFQNWGTSVLLTKAGLSYTEAHAGSGEFAITKLVHTLVTKMDETKSNLVLLDEPETSLYPGAQKRLLNFLLNVIENFKCQIIISTHSENFISALPASAIKAIHYNSATGKSTIKNNCLASTVFSELELPLHKINICLEDKAGCILLEAVAKQEEYNDLHIYNLDCGANELERTHIFSSSQENDQNTFYILDGDQFVNKVNIDELPQNKVDNEHYIDSLVKKICTTISFPSSKGRNQKNISSDPIKHNAELKYLKYFYNHVYFLPGENPESIIRDDTFISNFSKMLRIPSPDFSKLDDPDKKNKEKSAYHKLAVDEFGESLDNSEYYTIIKMLVNNWVKNKSNDDYCKIKNILTAIRKQYKLNNN